MSIKPLWETDGVLIGFAIVIPDCIEKLALEANREDLLNIISSESVCPARARIDPAVANFLFRSFLTSKPRGRGVGQSIRRTIVESHGETIRAEAHRGGGTTMTCSLRPS